MDDLSEYVDPCEIIDDDDAVEKEKLSEKSRRLLDLRGVKRYLNFLWENFETDRAEWDLRWNLRGN